MEKLRIPEDRPFVERSYMVLPEQDADQWLVEIDWLERNSCTVLPLDFSYDLTSQENRCLFDIFGPENSSMVMVLLGSDVKETRGSKVYDTYRAVRFPATMQGFQQWHANWYSSDYILMAESNLNLFMIGREEHGVHIIGEPTVLDARMQDSRVEMLRHFKSIALNPPPNHCFEEEEFLNKELWAHYGPFLEKTETV